MWWSREVETASAWSRLLAFPVLAHLLLVPEHPQSPWNTITSSPSIGLSSPSMGASVDVVWNISAWSTTVCCWLWAYQVSPHFHLIGGENLCWRTFLFNPITLWINEHIHCNYQFIILHKVFNRDVCLSVCRKVCQSIYFLNYKRVQIVTWVMFRKLFVSFSIKS